MEIDRSVVVDVGDGLLGMGSDPHVHMDLDLELELDQSSARWCTRWSSPW